MTRLATLFAIALLMAGCATPPPTNVHQPMTARPVPPLNDTAQNGTIYKAGNYRMALFEDKRARNVGDILTITIQETTNASDANNASFSRTASATASLTPNIFANPVNAAIDTTLYNGSTSNSSTQKDALSRQGAFTGTITVTVVDVLPNGNLIVSGEKQVTLSNTASYLRLSGVVDPRDLTSQNTVSSTQVADARIELKGTTSMDTAEVVTMLSKFFLSVIPF